MHLRRSRSPRREGGKGKGKDVGFAQAPRAGSPKHANAAVSATESDWAEDQDGGDDSDQSQLPSPTRWTCTKDFQPQIASRIDIEVDQQLTGHEMEKGFRTLWGELEEKKKEIRLIRLSINVITLLAWSPDWHGTSTTRSTRWCV